MGPPESPLQVSALPCVLSWAHTSSSHLQTYRYLYLYLLIYIKYIYESILGPPGDIPLRHHLLALLVGQDGHVGNLVEDEEFLLYPVKQGYLQHPRLAALTPGLGVLQPPARDGPHLA